ncbi:hypothetical protein P0F00_003073 [Vibrio metschnikovii]|nr:hypothetical protein [Vibrio metschnikovii]
MIDIFSDIEFDGYQHVNHMLFKEGQRQGLNMRFFHKFYMNYPNFDRISRLINGKLRSITHDSVSLDDQHSCPGVFRIKNLPASTKIESVFNGFLVNSQIKRKPDTLITFLPSFALSDVISGYKNVVYYCVHDSMKQSYNEMNLEFERKLLHSCSLTFCDNLDVANRLINHTGGEVVDISNFSLEDLIRYKSSGVRLFYVPPPVPEEFFCIDVVDEYKYDLVYFGSIHKDIDVVSLIELDKKGVKILIISNESNKITLSNGDVYPATSSFSKLCSLLSLSRSIILPYLDSDFMKTVSPAKIYQSMATKKRIYTTSANLLKKYPSLYSLDDYSECIQRNFHQECVENYRSSLLCNKIISLSLA